MSLRTLEKGLSNCWKILETVASHCLNHKIVFVVKYGQGVVLRSRGLSNIPRVKFVVDLGHVLNNTIYRFC